MKLEMEHAWEITNGPNSGAIETIPLKQTFFTVTLYNPSKMRHAA